MTIPLPDPRFARRAARLALGALLLACTGRSDDRSAAADAGAPGDSAESAALPPADTLVPARRGPLSPLADSIAQRLVFAPTVQNWFTAAGRGKRLLLDLGRIDTDLRNDAARRAAFEAAAEALSPVARGTRVLLRGGWGSDVATVSGFDVHNGRIVATLDAPPRVDSIAKVADPLVAAARIPLPPDAASTDDSCNRTIDPAWQQRLTALATQTEEELRAGDQPIYTRLQQNIRSRRSMTAGCFGEARAVVVVTLYAGDYEWVRERVLLVAEKGVKTATVRDLRFRAHEALHAFDADDDGTDDLAARAWTPRGGGTVVLQLKDGTRFERLAAGFSWER